jgi:AcrB/AcrD/AcrF family/Outer membrane efflux protein
VGLLLAEGTLAFAREVADAQAGTLGLSRARYEAGAISEADLARIETAKLEADQLVVQARAGLRSAQVAVAFLLGVRRAVPDFRAVPEELQSSVEPRALSGEGRDSLLARALSGRPDLVAARRQVERAEAALALARRQRLPDVSLSVSYAQQGTTNLAVSPPTWTVGLSLPLPLFHLRSGEIARAEAELAAQRLALARIEAGSVSDVETAWATFEQARALVARMEGGLLDRARTARDLVTIQYQKGAASLLELLDAHNVEEALSGVKGENSVKVVGPDLARNEATAAAIVDVMTGVPGVKDLGMLSSMGQPSIRIVPDRELCGRYGLNTGDVEAVVAAAIGGQVVTQVYEGERSFALTVRWLEPFRASVDAIRRIAVSSPDGSQIPLAQIASIGEEEAPSVVFREDGSRYAPVKFSVRGRDLGSTLQEATRQIAGKVRLPPETHLEWAGEINELREAMGRLAWVVPLSLVLVAFLVYGAVKTFRDTAVVLLSIPIAVTGGILALLVTGEAFSVSAAMGFVSIFGVAVQDAILVVTYSQRKWEEGLPLQEGALAAARQRFRAGLMTTLLATLGLLPAALSSGIGSQAQRPLAIVVIGGSLALAVLTRVVQPPLLVLAHRGRFAEGDGGLRPSAP